MEILLHYIQKKKIPQSASKTKENGASYGQMNRFDEQCMELFRAQCASLTPRISSLVQIARRTELKKIIIRKTKTANLLENLKQINYITRFQTTTKKKKNTNPLHRSVLLFALACNCCWCWLLTAFVCLTIIIDPVAWSTALRDTVCWST